MDHFLICHLSSDFNMVMLSVTGNMAGNGVTLMKSDSR
jgi:hypothetical protein